MNRARFNMIKINCLNSFRRAWCAVLCLTAAAVLGGCATPTEPEPAPAPVKKPEPASVVSTPAPKPVPPAPQPPPPVTEASVLKSGIAAYNNGEYALAIKRLGSTEIWGGEGSKAGQLEALKYMAFSYCLTQRQALCRAQFERALKIDPSFDLAPGEKGHPLWGPVFVKAQKAVKKK